MFEMTATTKGTRGSLRSTDWWQQVVDDLQAETAYHVWVFLRSLTPPVGAHGTRTRVFETLESAVEAGLVDEYEVVLLGEGLCLCSDCRDRQQCQTHYEYVEDIRSWRRDEARPAGFETRTIESAYTGESYEVLEPPQMTVCVRDESSIKGVFPCTDGEDHLSVGDFIEVLEQRPLEPRSDKGTVLTY